MMLKMRQAKPNSIPAIARMSKIMTSSRWKVLTIIGVPSCGTLTEKFYDYILNSAQKLEISYF